MAHTYEYPRPSVTVDCVIFGAAPQFSTSELKILLIERRDAPFKGRWALPGGFVNMNESLDAAAARELKEETGLSLESVYLEQLRTFGAPKRDPRGRVITVAYFALLNLTEMTPVAGSDAARAEWFELDKLPKLAFDHATIVATAVERLRGKVRYAPIGFNLMPKTFTLSQLHALYEGILGRPVLVANFRRAMYRMGLLKVVGEQRSVQHRPAKLYQFDVTRYEQLRKRGFNFEI